MTLLGLLPSLKHVAIFLVPPGPLNVMHSCSDGFWQASQVDHGPDLANVSNSCYLAPRALYSSLTLAFAAARALNEMQQLTNLLVLKEKQLQLNIWRPWSQKALPIALQPQLSGAYGLP